jgi:hypothetical protein
LPFPLSRTLGRKLLSFEVNTLLKLQSYSWESPWWLAHIGHDMIENERPCFVKWRFHIQYNFVTRHAIKNKEKKQQPNHINVSLKQKQCAPTLDCMFDMVFFWCFLYFDDFNVMI